MAIAEVNVICEILEALSLLEAKIFLYVAVGDDRTCPECAGFNGQLFTEEEAERVFPYLEKDTRVWHPNVHPNCRCKLTLQYETEEFLASETPSPCDLGQTISLKEVKAC
ncbi:MAG: phage minor head protein [Candidatus Bathyarchaeia archaeon]